MKLAILTLTPGGVATAKKLKRDYPKAEFFTLKKHLEEGFKEIQPSLEECVHELFETQDCLLFIMATGIVVRTIAPFIKHKTLDPAVLVMDEKGAFVISLLSGHIGKANEWTHEIANHLKAQPVITTASDVNDLIAVDVLAVMLHCGIDSMEQAKKLTALLLENKKVGVLSQIPIPIMLKMPLVKLDPLSPDELLLQKGLSGLIIISKERPKPRALPQVWLMPKDFVVGIGCKRGKTEMELRALLEEVFEKHHLNIQRLDKIATVDIKSDETGLLQLARNLEVTLECLPREAIQLVEDQFQGSEFVQKTLGVKAVSEPCGYIGSGYGKCLVPVIKADGITLSVWEKRTKSK